MILPTVKDCGDSLPTEAAELNEGGKGMPEDLIERAKEFIQAALAANAEERDRLTRSLAHLQQRPTTPRRAKKAGRRRVTAARRGERPKQVMAELRKAPGTAAELAKRIGMTPSGIHPVLKRLHGDGKAEKHGAVYAVAPDQSNESGVPRQPRAQTGKASGGKSKRGRRKGSGKKAGGGAAGK